MKEKQICLICLWPYIFCSTKRNYVLTCEGKTLWLPLIKVRKKNCYKAAPPRGVRTGNNSTQTCWCTRFWKHHAVFPENWPEPFTEGLDSIRNVCVLCQAMPYGWRQREHFVGPAVLWTIARPLRHIVPPRRSMQSPRAKKLAWNLNKKISIGAELSQQIKYDSFFPAVSGFMWQTKRPPWDPNYELAQQYLVLPFSAGGAVEDLRGSLGLRMDTGEQSAMGME